MGRTDQYTFGINSFNPGMRCDADPDDIGGVYARLIKNGNLNKIGAVTTRKGNKIIGDPEFRTIVPQLEDLPLGPASASSTGSTLVMGSSVFFPWSVGAVVKNVIDLEQRTITGYTNGTTVTVDSPINDTWDGDTITITYVDTTPNDGWIQQIYSVVGKDGRIYWEKVHRGVIYRWDFDNEDWLAVALTGGTPFYNAFDYFTVEVSNTTAPGRTSNLIITTSTFSTAARGMYVYNSTTGESRKIVGYSSATLVVLDRPIIGANWIGEEIIVYSEISATEFNNEIYYMSSAYEEYLYNTIKIYNDQGILTNYNYADGSTFKILGSLVTTANNSLFVAGNHLLPRHMIWSNPDTDQFHSVTAVAGANADTAGANTITITQPLFTTSHVGTYIYNPADAQIRRITSFTSTTVVTTDGSTATWDNDTLYIFTNFFAADNSITAIQGLDTQVAVFDHKNLYLVDNVNSTTKIFRGKGTISPKSVAVSNEGDLYWISSSLEVYRLPKGGTPEKVSSNITNKNMADSELGIIDLINPDFVRRIAGGIYNNNNEYLLSLGTLTDEYFGHTIENAVAIYNPIQDNWRIDTYPGGVFHTTIDENNEPVTLYGSYSEAAVFSAYGKDNYKDDTSTFDGGNPVEEDIDFVLDLHKTTLNRPDENKQVSMFVRIALDDPIVEGEGENPDTGGALVEIIKDDDTNYHAIARFPPTEEYVTYHIPVEVPVESMGVRITGRDRIDVSSILFRCKTSELQNIRY